MFLKRIIDYFNPTRISDATKFADFEESRKNAITLSLFLTIGTFVFVAFSARLYIEGSGSFARLYPNLYLIFLFLVALPITLKLTGKRTAIASSALLIACGFLCYRVSLTGGADSPLNYWFFTIPLVSVLIGSLRLGLITVIVCSSCFTFFLFSEQLGIVFPSYDNPKIIELLFGLVVLFVNFSIIYTYEKLKNTYIVKIHTAEVKASQLKKEKAINQLSKKLAHEINNPLTVLLGNLGRLNKTPDLPPELSSRLEKSNNAAIRIRNIVDRVQLLSRVNDVNYSELNLLEVINQEVKSIGHLMDVHFSNMSGNNILTIRGSHQQLSLVFQSLFENSFEAMENSEAKEVFITVKADHHMVRILIKDNGPSVPLELKSKIFEPFFSTKPLKSGLGLNISSNILEHHNGSLQRTDDHFEIRVPLIRKKGKTDKSMKQEGNTKETKNEQ